MSKVLVVDDDPHIRELLRHVLEVALFEVEEAEDGADALSRHAPARDPISSSST